MHPTDFAAFCTLLSDIHVKAFDEPISRLTFSKAEMLSWLILEATGELLSYKSLTKYFLAVQEACPQQINPNLTTLGILMAYATGQAPGSLPPLVLWRQYRNQLKHAA